MDLAHHSADSRLIRSHDNEHILYDESETGQFIDDFDVCQSLLISANLVGTFDDVNSLVPQNPMRLGCRREVEFQNCFVVFFGNPVGSVVPVILLIVLVADVGGAAGRVHVGRIKYHGID